MTKTRKTKVKPHLRKTKKKGKVPVKKHRRTVKGKSKKKYKKVLPGIEVADDVSVLGFVEDVKDTLVKGYKKAEVALKNRSSGSDDVDEVDDWDDMDEEEKRWKKKLEKDAMFHPGKKLKDLTPGEWAVEHHDEDKALQDSIEDSSVRYDTYADVRVSLGKKKARAHMKKNFGWDDSDVDYYEEEYDED
jgi:hypothetical protein